MPVGNSPALQMSEGFRTKTPRVKLYPVTLTPLTTQDLKPPGFLRGFRISDMAKPIPSFELTREDGQKMVSLP